MSRAIIDRVRQPEYTGSNRCLPCTVVNVVIALVLTAVIGWVALPVGVAFLVVALGGIALRGYLVPGTPELTARYMPDRIYRLFGHGSDIDPDHADALEETLIAWDVLEECEHEDDLCLRSNIQNAYTDRLEHLRTDGVDEESLANLFDRDPEAVTVTPRKPPAVRVSGSLSKWPSSAALKADVAMADVLDEHTTEWADTALQQRGPLLAGLRPFVETCPECDGELELDEEVVKSCCRSHDVVRLRCRDCEQTLFEVDSSALKA